MDLLRRSFRRGSIRRPPREPLAESPSFDSPLEEHRSQGGPPTSPMDRLRRSFRRNFRGCGHPVTDSSTHLPTSSLMERLRGSFRRSFRHKSSDERASPDHMSVSDKLRRSFRRMKKQQEKTTMDPTTTTSEESATMANIRRNLRRSLRRQKEPESSYFSSRLQYWQTDEMDVRAGTCFFNVKYLGCVEVFEPRGLLMCEEAFKMLKKSRKRTVKSILFISANGLRVVDKNTRGLIVDQSIDMLSFCGPVRLHDRGFSFICLNVATLKWMCYCFVAKESGERLSNAVGYAFAIYFERKKKSDKNCAVTMNFDLSSATFTRIGSFKRQSLTETLRDKTNSNNVEGDSSRVEGQSETLPPPTTIININNNISTDFEENKENIPCRAYERARTACDFERSLHSVSAALRRQRSLRELPRLNQSGETSPFFRRQSSLRLRELPSTIERVKSLSAEFTFDARASSSTHFSRYHTPVSPIAEMSPANTPDKVSVEARTTTSVGYESVVRQQLVQKFDPLPKFESNQVYGVQELMKKAEADRSIQEANISNSSGHSQHPSTYSSIEGITLTPPATPSPARLARLLEPNPWSNNVSNVSRELDALVTNEQPVAVTNNGSSNCEEGSCRRRSHSLSYAEGISRRTDDPFDIDWSLWTTNITSNEAEVTQPQKKKKKNTNPFVPNSPDTPEKIRELVVPDKISQTGTFSIT